jgi:outer membrane protein assembly factor BamB
MIFERAADGTLDAFAVLPAIEAWRIPLGKATVHRDSAQVRIGGWSLDWKEEGPALEATLPGGLVPVHEIRAELKPCDPWRPADLPAPGEPAPVAEPVWTHDAGAPIWAGVAAGDATVWVGTDAGELLAVDAGSGARRWSLATGGSIRARPTLQGARLFVPSDDGHVYAVDANDGRVVWKRRVVEGAIERGKRYDHYAAAVTIDGDTLYVAGADGGVHALVAASGEPRWSRRVGDAVTSAPVPAGGRVHFGSFDGKVYAFDAASGAPVWEHDTGGAVASPVAVAGGKVLAGSRSYDLLALDAASGEEVWSRYYWFSWVDSEPVVDSDTVYVGSSDALRLFAFDLASGEPRWSFRTGGWTWPAPALDDETVYAGAVGTGDYIGERRGGFFAVRRADGRPVWRYLPPRPAGNGNDERWGFASSPAVAGGRVFVGGLDGKLYAFNRR